MGALRQRIDVMTDQMDDFEGMVTCATNRPQGQGPMEEVQIHKMFSQGDDSLSVKNQESVAGSVVGSRNELFMRSSGMEWQVPDVQKDCQRLREQLAAKEKELELAKELQTSATGEDGGEYPGQDELSGECDRIRNEILAKEEELKSLQADGEPISKIANAAVDPGMLRANGPDSHPLRELARGCAETETQDTDSIPLGRLRTSPSRLSTPPVQTKSTDKSLSVTQRPGTQSRAPATSQSRDLDSVPLGRCSTVGSNARNPTLLRRTSVLRNNSSECRALRQELSASRAALVEARKEAGLVPSLNQKMLALQRDLANAKKTIDEWESTSFFSFFNCASRPPPSTLASA